MEKALDLIVTEVQKHIRLAELLQNRNEELSRENIRLKIQLKDEEVAKRKAQVKRDVQGMEDRMRIDLCRNEAENQFLQMKISTLKTQLEEKEKELSIAKDETQLNQKLRKKVSSESEELQDKCDELAKQLEIIKREADSSRNSSSSNNVGDFLRSHSQRLGALQKTLERHLQLEQSVDITVNKKTYVVFLNNIEHKQFFADNNVQFIHDPEDVPSIVANSHKEMFLLLDGHHLENSNSDGEFAVKYEKILSICQKWKELRADGEIHVIGWNWWGSSPLSVEMRAMFTSHETITVNKIWEKELSIVVFKFWPNYYKQLLSDAALKECLPEFFSIR